MQNVIIEQMKSPRGNPVANQFIIRTFEGTYFQSYQTIIAFRPTTGKIQLDEKMWDYSRTTGKYRNIFLGRTKKELEDGIKRGFYELTNLNNERRK